MSQTLINGTAYTINHGNTLINNTQYTINSGLTLINGTSYTINLSSSASFEWVGWSNATWEDLNNLCYAKKTGLIDAWPNDIILGNTKNCSLSTSILGKDTYEATLIGIDVDGQDTLTFATQRSSQKETFSDNYSASWSSSKARNTYCNNFYNAFEGKDYIITITKGTNTQRNQSSIGYTSETVWIPSIYEMNGPKNDVYSYTNEEYTQGVNTYYPYFATTLDSNFFDQAWTRTLSNSTADALLVPIYDSYSQTINAYGSSASSNAYYSFAFTIGNPNAQTIN